MANFAVYSNSTGYAKAYITAPNSSRLNFTLFGFNGNSTLVGNLVGWWPLEEGYGNTVYDLGTHSNNGVFNSPSWSTLANQTNIAAASFNGANSYVTATIQSNIWHALTLSFWMDPATLVSQQNFLDVGTGASVIEPYSPSNIFHCYTPSADLSSGVTLSTGTWYHLVCAYNGSKLFAYVNGALKASTALSSYSLTGNSIFIGSSMTPNYFTQGLFSDVQLYNTTLSAAQVQRLYQEGIAGSPIGNAGLAGWWPLSYTANDFSGNNNVGTPSNVVYNNVAYPAPANSVNVASFNGIGSYVAIPSSGVSFNGKSSISIVAWIDPSSFPADPDFSTIVTKSAAYYLQLTSAGKPAAYLQNVNSGYFYSPSAVASNTWSQVAFTYSGSKETLYVNGQAVNSITASGTITDTGNNYLGIGANLNTGGTPYTSYNRRFNGLIADVQVYNAPLTAQQVQQLYLQGLPMYNKLNVTFG
jgi:hypothetical protein